MKDIGLPMRYPQTPNIQNREPQNILFYNNFGKL